MFHRIITLLLLAPWAHGVSAANDSCNVFLLKEAESRLAIEKVVLEDGEVTVFPYNAASEHITALLPFGVGQSGDVVQREVGEGKGIVRCAGGEIRVTYTKADGSEHVMPPVKVEDLSGYDMRVNVIGANGLKEAFLIRAGETVTRASGPVIDMFGGMIPLQEGDYSITTETSVHEVMALVEGAADIVFNGEHLYVKGRIANGATGYFFVDFGAASTVVVQDAIPSGSEIEKLRGIEYSGNEQREVEGTIGGLGGDVQSFLGKTDLSEIGFGNVTFTDVSAGVITEMPDFSGFEPIGILGLDLLSRAEVVSIDYGTEESPGGRLVWGKQSASAPGSAIEVPFSVAGDHLFIPGSIGGEAVSFVLDTGARISMISESLAERAGVVFEEGAELVLRGLDENTVTATRTRADEISLGATRFSEVSLYAGDFSVLDQWGLAESGAIIGNDFLGRFRKLEIDHVRSVIRLTE